jgi:hypothetical protein
VPSPRDALPLLVGALRETFAADLRCVLFKGSALREDHIPYFSDLDVHAMVAGVGPGRAPDWVRAMVFQRAIGRIDPEMFGVGAFQVEFAPPEGYPPGWPVPYASTYEVLFGGAPFGEPSAEAHLEQARDLIARAAADRDELVRGFADRADGALSRPLRLLGTFLTGRLRAAAALLTGDPERAYVSRREPLVRVVGEALGNERELILFYALAGDWREVRAYPEQLRAMFATGMAAFEAFADWSLEGSAARP